MLKKFSRKTKWNPFGELSQVIERLTSESKNTTKRTLNEVRLIYNSLSRSRMNAFDPNSEEIRPEALRERMICAYQTLAPRSFG